MVACRAACPSQMTSIDDILTPTGAALGTYVVHFRGAGDGESVGKEDNVQHARVITASAGRSHKATREASVQSLGLRSQAIDSNGRTIWIGDAANSLDKLASLSESFRL